MMNDIELKMKKDFDALKDAIEQTDFVEETIKGVKSGTEEKMEMAEDMIALAKSAETSVAENLEAFNELVKTQAPKITREEFMFPEGKKSAIYETHLEALHFADKCTQCSVVLKDMQNSVEDLRKVRDDNIEELFGEKQNLKQDLNGSSAESFPFFECVQTVVCQQIETTKTEIKEKCRKIKQKYQMEKPSVPYLANIGKKIGIACGIFFGIMYIVGTFSAMIEDVAAKVLTIILPPVGATLIYLAIILIPYFVECGRYKKDMCRFTELQSLCVSADIWMDEILETFDQKIMFDTIKSRIYAEVTVPLFEAWRNAGNYVDKVYKFSRTTVQETIESLEKAVAFLPPQFPRESLAYVIECMESGRASDYQSALHLWETE